MLQRRAHVLTIALLVMTLISLPARADEPMVDFAVVHTDTLIGLSRNVLISPAAWREVARINRLPNPELIMPGQILRIPVRLMRGVPVNARLISVNGDVRIGETAATEGALLQENQNLQTGLSSSAVVELADGSRVKLPPSSLAALAASRHYADRPLAATATAIPETPGASTTRHTSGLFAGTLRVLRGSVEVFATKVLRAKPLEVITPTAVVGVRGTHYRVGLNGDAGEITHAEVLEGAVRFDVPRAGSGIDLPSGSGIAVVAGSTSMPETVTLLAAPDLSTVPVLFERPVVRFFLPDETVALRMQVASDPDFEKIVRDQRVEPGSEVRIVGLDDGQWYLRFRRVDAQRIEGFDSTQGLALKARPEPAVQRLPRADAKQTVGTVNFSWAQNVEAPSVRLQVAEDIDFTRMVADRDHLAESSIDIEMKTAALYFWRLQSIRLNGDHGPFSDPQRFELRPLPEAPTMHRSTDENTLVLKWGGRPLDRYHVQLARDAAFTDMVSEAELSTSEWSQPVPEKSGRYFFRYRTIELDEFTSPYSATLRFDIPRDWRSLWMILPLFLIL